MWPESLQLVLRFYLAISSLIELWNLLCELPLFSVSFGCQSPIEPPSHCITEHLEPTELPWHMSCIVSPCKDLTTSQKVGWLNEVVTSWTSIHTKQQMVLYQQELLETPTIYLAHSLAYFLTALKVLRSIVHTLFHMSPTVTGLYATVTNMFTRITFSCFKCLIVTFDIIWTDRLAEWCVSEFQNAY